MISLFTIIPCLFGGSLFIGCDQPFDPRGSLDKRLVVFSVLSTDRDAQFVRVEQVYMPAGYDALVDTADRFVGQAEVQIMQGGSTRTLVDTTMPRTDTSRYRTPLRAYSVKPFRVSYGSSYTIAVRSSQYDQVSASVAIPEKPSLVFTPVSNDILDHPGDHKPETEIVVTINLGNGSMGFVGRLFLDYDVLEGSEWVSKRTEVPASYAFSGLKDFRYVKYGELKHAGYNNVSAGIYMNDLY